MKQIIGIGRAMYAVYVKQRVSRAAASLAYFLTISIFPLLICVSAVLGSLNLSENDVFFLWRDIIPAQAIGIIGEFLQYVNGNLSTVMVFVGITTMLTSSAAAFRTITGIMGDIQGQKRFHGIWGLLFDFALSFGFLAVIYVSGLVIVTGEWFLRLLQTNFSVGDFVGAWNWIRFLLLFIVMFVVILCIYKVSAPKTRKGTRGIRRLPGALASAGLLVVVSTVFSRLISGSVKYAVVYGTLASLIILMSWLYICAIIVIMGNVLNICIARERKPNE
ncbi:MAG: YihY/virulence factor BrkB family protein [Oscillospiraceae bacterium]|nr:YihY/virulence factor BrkB family protein [Oscillospiraceae bacterium]